MNAGYDPQKRHSRKMLGEDEPAAVDALLGSAGSAGARSAASGTDAAAVSGNGDGRADSGTGTPVVEPGAAVPADRPAVSSAVFVEASELTGGSDAADAAARDRRKLIGLAVVFGLALVAFVVRLRRRRR